MAAGEELELRGKQHFSIVGNRSVSDNGLYIPFVIEAASNPAIFAIFKSHPIYRNILEHVGEADGQKYLDIIRRDNPHYFNKINDLRLNDVIGQPFTCKYGEIGYISPTTLRYIKVASDLRKYFGEGFKYVCEVGCGYGGQTLIIDKLFHIKQYCLFDLPPVLNLVSRYIESHQLNSSYKCMTINQTCGDEDYDLAISNYAFSELPALLQNLYIRKIFLKSRKGYLTMNSGLPNSAFKDDKLSLAELKELLPSFDVFEEYPLSSEGNYIIVWGHR